MNRNRPPRPRRTRKPNGGGCHGCCITVADCLRIGEHYPYRTCCKACDHRTTDGKRKS